MSPIASRILSSAKWAAGLVGADVIRLRNSPRHTWLALGRMPIRTIVDVGANRGQFAAEARRRFPAATIHALEPLPGPFRELDAWARTQGGAVTTYQVAASDRSGAVAMNVHVEHSPSSSLLLATELNHQLHPFTECKETVSVQADLLDNVLAGVALQSPLLVKLDVQGFEDRVIRGGRTVLGAASAVIAEVSIDVLYDGQATFRDVYTELDALGFVYAGNVDQGFAADGRVISLDALFLRPA